MRPWASLWDPRAQFGAGFGDVFGACFMVNKGVDSGSDARAFGHEGFGLIDDVASAMRSQGVICDRHRSHGWSVRFSCGFCCVGSYMRRARWIGHRRHCHRRQGWQHRACGRRQRAFLHGYARGFRAFSGDGGALGSAVTGRRASGKLLRALSEVLTSFNDDEEEAVTDAVDPGKQELSYDLQSLVPSVLPAVWPLKTKLQRALLTRVCDSVERVH